MYRQFRSSSEKCCVPLIQRKYLRTYSCAETIFYLATTLENSVCTAVILDFEIKICYYPL